MSPSTASARARGQPAACSERGRGGGALRCRAALCGFRMARRFWTPRSGTARRYQQPRLSERCACTWRLFGDFSLFGDSQRLAHSPQQLPKSLQNNSRAAARESAGGGCCHTLEPWSIGDHFMCARQGEAGRCACRLGARNTRCSPSGDSREMSGRWAQPACRQLGGSLAGWWRWVDK